MSASAAAAPRVAPRAARKGHLSFGRLLLIALLVIAVVLAAAVVIVLKRTPPAPRADCTTGEQCGNPPPGKPLVNTQIWTSTALGYHFQYDDELWELTDEDEEGVVLEVQRGGVTVIVNGAQSSELDPEAAFDETVSNLDGLLALADDTNPDHVILGPKVGDFHADAVGVFQGSTSPAQGQVLQVRVIVMSATDGETTVTLTLVSPENNLAIAAQHVDGMLNTLRYPSESDV
jgi:hypothetical protein